MSSPTESSSVPAVPLDRPELAQVVYPSRQPLLTIDPSDEGDAGETVYRKTWFPFSLVWPTRTHVNPARVWYFHTRAVNALSARLTPEDKEHYPPRETYPPDAYESSVVKFRHTRVGKADEVFTAAYAIKNRKGWEYRATTLTLQISYPAVGFIGQQWGAAETLAAVHTPSFEDPGRLSAFFLIEQMTKRAGVDPYHFVSQLSYEALNTLDLRTHATLKPLSELAEERGPHSLVTKAVNLIFDELAERNRRAVTEGL